MYTHMRVCVCARVFLFVVCVCLSVCLSVSLSLCLFVCLYVSLFVSLFSYVCLCGLMFLLLTML